MTQGTCRCGKLGYTSELAAQAALASTTQASTRSRRRREFRYYRCHLDPDRWHLSSRSEIDPSVYDLRQARRHR